VKNYNSFSKGELIEIILRQLGGFGTAASKATPTLSGGKQSLSHASPGDRFMTGFREGRF